MIAPSKRLRTDISLPRVTRAVVIGCGRRYHRDDQVGIAVAEALAAVGLPYVAITTTEAPCASLFNGLGNDCLLVLIDAAQRPADVPAGACERIDYRCEPDRLHLRRRTNTHDLSVDSALALGAALDLLPPRVWVYAIAGEDFAAGDQMSPALSNAIPTIVERLRRDLARLLTS